MSSALDMQMASREKIPTQVLTDPADVNAAVAREIAELIRVRQAEGKTCVLGLATGSTPTGVYAELVRMHKEEGLSFKNVVSFNLDEYFPMQPNELQSYHRFMNEHLFSHIDIDPKNVHVPDGTLSIEEVPHYCQAYEKAIRDAGGIDIQLLGIGRTGHIGFNEPGSGKGSRTRLIWLDRKTRIDAASDFFGMENVPTKAITMGVGTILDARRIIMMAFGEGKARISAEAIEGEVTPVVAASFLQDHPNAQVMLDSAAAAHLTRTNLPWLVGPCDWDAKLIRRAVIWLAQLLDKPVLKLTDEDYNESGLQELIAEHGPAYEINRNVFRYLQATITGWPGGKPSSAKRPGDLRRASDEVFPKRCICFSPHPDDDVISMGGTLIRLCDQGHDMHIAYQTSGNIAVFDEDALRFADFAKEFNELFGISDHKAGEIEEHIEEFLRNKKPGQVDSPEIQKLKGLIRRGEARAGGRYCGVSDENLHFLDMPFYETGTVRKKPVGEEDIQIIVDLLQKIQPHQIYAAGDLSDPHGTHRVCLMAIFAAIHRVKNEAWFKDCQVWLYRGAWQEWEPEHIEMAVPISPQELQRKRQAIFKHESQKDKALFPGSDPREFWQRAEDRNRGTAKLYDALGLAEYEAIEAFVRWVPDLEGDGGTVGFGEAVTLAGVQSS
ncbi:glucosamine-6-phosphate deaminase [Mucisphaera calidilacus]|uniref:Glucosamine-6-phosphate deaminase n=1 Tax=Mucisphaera calidilacus TaxID=2527982 RepID=A0A518BZB2_9BACT|nr:glucosamine-6-phosphate deaminase [Mucisphaera calidilacus]QDU72308.1 Glucosamine-6-phosphate deaminase 1 [Mucisphaera calidilacus]